MSAAPDDTRTVHIANRAGMHARPAAEFVKRAKQYRSDILVRKDEMEVNGKSIMGLMMLAAEFGSAIQIRAQGEDCTKALDDLVQLVENGFGEP